MIKPVVYPITLDVYKTGSQKVLSMVRGDNKRVIVIALTENDKPYVITDGCTAKFTALKPDGKFIYNDCEIDAKNNTIVYQVTDQTTAVNGIVPCQIRLIGANGGILSAPSFTMVVSDLLYNEEPIVDSSNEFNALTRFLADLQYKLDNGEFNGKSIYIKGSVSDASELEAKIPTAVAGDGYLADDCHLYVFDGTAFVDVGAVRGERGFSGVYVGEGEMPDGYNVQIVPDGEVFEMEYELNETSNNPVTNAAITCGINAVREECRNIIDVLSTGLGELSETASKNSEDIYSIQNGLDAIRGSVSGNATAIKELKGFGLGTNAPEVTVNTVEELDALTKTGWYGLNVSAWSGDRADIFGVYFNFATVHVVSIESGTFYQELYIHPHSSQRVIRRWYHGGSFSPWEPKYPITETGEWQPRLLTGTGADLSCTYEQQAGLYSRVGDLVFVFGRIRFKNCESGQLARVSLPFAEKKVDGGGAFALTIHKAVNCFAENGVCKELSISSLTSDAKGSAIPVTESYSFLRWLGGAEPQELMFSGTYIVR